MLVGVRKNGDVTVVAKSQDPDWLMGQLRLKIVALIGYSATPEV
jgi:hypothetical protein